MREDKTSQKHLLYLARRHNAFLRVSWIKGHSSDYSNSRADELALLGINTQHFPFNVTSLATPPGWVDTLPVLNSQSLAHLTYAIVRHNVPPPSLARSSPLSAPPGHYGCMNTSTPIWTSPSTSVIYGPLTSLQASADFFGRLLPAHSPSVAASMAHPTSAASAAVAHPSL